MLLLLLNHVVWRALWKIDVYLISTLVYKSLYYYVLFRKILFLIPGIKVVVYSLVHPHVGCLDNWVTCVPCAYNPYLLLFKNVANNFLPVIFPIKLVT